MTLGGYGPSGHRQIIKVCPTRIDHWRSGHRFETYANPLISRDGLLLELFLDTGDTLGMDLPAIEEIGRVQAEHDLILTMNRPTKRAATGAQPFARVERQLCTCQHRAPEVQVIAITEFLDLSHRHRSHRNRNRNRFLEHDLGRHWNR